MREPLPPGCGFQAKCCDRKRVQNTPYDGGFTIEEHIYTMHRLKDANGLDHCVMLHQTVTNPIAALVKGYHRHRKPDKYPRLRRTKKSHWSQFPLPQHTLLLQSNP